jgi:hypothetical protein
MTNEVDKFGIGMLYPSANSEQDWSMSKPYTDQDKRLELAGNWKVACFYTIMVRYTDIRHESAKCAS